MLARLKLGTALSLGFAAALGVALLIAGISFVGLQGVEKGVNELSDLALPNTRALAKVDEARATILRNLNALLLRRLIAAQRQENWARLDQATNRFHEGRKEFEAIPCFAETDAAWKAMVQAAEPWERQVHTTLEALKQRETLLAGGLAEDSPQVKEVEAQSWAGYVESRKLGRSVDAEFVKVRAAMEKEAHVQADRAHAAARQAQVTLTLVLLIGAALLVALAIGLTRGISGIVQGLAAESNKLSSAVRAGKLQMRAETQTVHFQFRGVVDGMNQTMDAFANPIRMASQSMERISQGDIPEQVTDSYEGDFDQIKQSVNRCIGAVAAVVQDGRALSTAAVEGKLSARSDASRHQGDFRKIVEGFNGTLDAVMKPIGEATQVLQRLAQRDLRARVKGSYQGDHAKITDALNATAEALHDAMAQVAQGVDQVSSASAQIASSSQAVASGASEQASSLEETGSSLESMSSMTKQAADNAQQASALATTAKGAATEGSAAMEQMTGAMAKIKASAEGTSQIIKDINEIAFQTNLLALNAAVEAARAGEAGRGFAVVAEEVRSLALRSKEAANKTEELIRQSVREAGEGEVTAKHVNGKLSEIVASVSKVTDIVAEITATAKEQAVGIEQVNKAMTQMNTVTQQNAASSEESSSAAAELSGQSEELAAMVGLFQLDGVAATRKSAATKAVSSTVRKAPRARQSTAEA